jgi:transposase
MEIDPHSLPQDAAALRQMVLSLLEELDSKERRLTRVQHMLEQLLRWRYGPKRERVDENQLFLFAAAVVHSGQDVQWV